MFDIVKQLQQQHAITIEDAREVKRKAADENRDLAEGEVKEFDKFMAEASRLEAELDREIKLRDAADYQTSLGKSERKVATVQPHTEERVEIPHYSGSLSAFKGPKAAENAYRSGKWLLGHVYDNAPAREWCRDNGVQSRAMGEGIATKGGVLVPDIFESAIIDLRDTFGLARQECNVMPMSSDTLLVPRRTGGTTVFFPGENQETTASDASFDNVQMTAKKAAQLVRVSNELNEDALISMADWLAGEFGQQFAEKEDDILFNGTGTSTFGGMVGIRTKMVDGDHDGSNVDAVSGNDSFGDFDLVDFTGLMAALPTYAANGAKWYISNVGWGLDVLRLSTAVAGNNATDLVAGIPRSQFLGFPLLISSKMPTDTGATAMNDIVAIMFGNMRSAVTLGDRRGITIKVDPSRYLEFDQLGIMATERFDIVVHDVGDTSNAGPLVGLLGNT